MLFYGLASVEGLNTFKAVPYTGSSERFDIPERSKNIMWFQVKTNQDKMAVMYRGELEPEDAEIIGELQEKDMVKALVLLKEKMKDVFVASPGDAVSFWEKIPA